MDVDTSFQSCQPRLLVAENELGKMAGLSSPLNHEKLQRLRRFGFDAGWARLQLIHETDSVWWSLLDEDDRQQEVLGAAFPAMVDFLLTKLLPERR